MFKSKKNDLDVIDEAQLLDKLSFHALEAYKLLRTNIGFTIDDDLKCKVIGITSSTRGEGKSTLSINLSHVIAQDNKKVLLVEGDLRLPTFVRRLNLDGFERGLTNIIGRKNSLDKLIPQLRFDDNFYVLTSGPIPPNPSEILGGTKMDTLLKNLKPYFDYIVFDLPPVNVVADPLAISSKLDGMLVCVRENYVLMREVRETINKLKLVDANILGFVITNDETNEKKYGYNYRYKKYGRGKYGKYYRNGYYNKYSYEYYRKHTKEIEKEEKEEIEEQAQ